MVRCTGAPFEILPESAPITGCSRRSPHFGSVSSSKRSLESEFDAFLCLDTLIPERVLDHTNLAD
jgi:hypothetical protein